MEASIPGLVQNLALPEGLTFPNSRDGASAAVVLQGRQREEEPDETQAHCFRI